MLVDYLHLMCTHQTLVQLRCVGVVRHMCFFLLFLVSRYQLFSDDLAEFDHDYKLLN
ncbi:hypothetical protein AMTRI_Chr07g78100 [Amborella trichopoda]